MPEHPPCLTPTLRQRSSFRSDLILFKCFIALSVREIAGAKPSTGAAETEEEDDRIERRLRRLWFDGKETEKGFWLELNEVEEFLGKLQIVEENPSTVEEQEAIFFIAFILTQILEHGDSGRDFSQEIQGKYRPNNFHSMSATLQRWTTIWYLRLILYSLLHQNIVLRSRINIWIFKAQVSHNHEARNAVFSSSRPRVSVIAKWT